MTPLILSIDGYFFVGAVPVRRGYFYSVITADEEAMVFWLNDIGDDIARDPIMRGGSTLRAPFGAKTAMIGHRSSAHRAKGDMLIFLGSDCG